MKNFTRFLFFLLGASLVLSWSSCELTDDEACQFQRDDVSNWYDGYSFDYFHIEDFDIPNSGSIYNINPGNDGNMIILDNICTDNPVSVHAVITTTSAFSESFDHVSLRLGSLVGTLKLTYSKVNFYRTDAIHYEANIEDALVLPYLFGEGFPGTLLVKVIFLFNEGTIICSASDASWTAEQWLRDNIQNIKVTVSYTEL